MTNNSKRSIAEFERFERIYDPGDLAIVQEFIDNPDFEENKQRITKFFAKMNVEIDADALANAIPKHKKLLNF